MCAYNECIARLFSASQTNKRRQIQRLINFKSANINNNHQIHRNNHNQNIQINQNNLNNQRNAYHSPPSMPSNPRHPKRAKDRPPMQPSQRSMPQLSQLPARFVGSISHPTNHPNIWNKCNALKGRERQRLIGILNGHITSWRCENI